MATEALFRHVPIPEERVFRMRGENPDPDRAADEYEAILRDVFELPEGAWPRFDLVLLGLGADGHTASLFPGAAAPRPETRLVRAVRGGPPSVDRLSLTLPVMNRSAAALFLVSGVAKAEALRRVAGGAADLPAAAVRPSEGDLIWLVDKDAAHLLPR